MCRGEEELYRLYRQIWHELHAIPFNLHSVPTGLEKHALRSRTCYKGVGKFFAIEKVSKPPMMDIAENN
jgi:hypothetical protein